MIGVNFQPGQQKDNGQNGNGGSRPGSGVQEAIKVLSLRLPRVVGAQASASLPLLTSQGSGGNPRVDSVVNQVMQRMLSQGPQAPPPMPMLPSGGAAPVVGDRTGQSSPMPLPNWPAPPQPQAPPPQMPPMQDIYGKPRFDFREDPPAQPPPGPNPPSPPPGPAWPNPFQSPRERGPLRS